MALTPVTLVLALALLLTVASYLPTRASAYLLALAVLVLWAARPGGGA